jgi:hypothetical protein
MNTKIDLEQAVASRLKQSVDGKSIDTTKPVKLHLPHLIGVTDLYDVHDPENEEGTLIDSSHEFWKEYSKPVRTRNAAISEIVDVMHDLSESGHFDVNRMDSMITVDVTVPESHD